jgi:hypothetical protein
MRHTRYKYSTAQYGTRKIICAACVSVARRVVCVGIAFLYISFYVIAYTIVHIP